MGTNAQEQANGKLKIGMYWASSCGGCDISLLEIGPRILELIQLADVVLWPCVADFKYHHAVNYPDGYMDVCFYNGGIRSSEQEEIMTPPPEEQDAHRLEPARWGGIPAGQPQEPRRDLRRRVPQNPPSTIAAVGPERFTRSPANWNSPSSTLPSCA
jgi:F420-non-reducing hydrogenase small subunit